MTEVTELLQAIENGDEQAEDRLLPLVYDQLRQLARTKMTAERADHTLQATALVHEAYLRMVGGQQNQSWNGRGHFFGAAAEAMRRILIDNARRKKSAKRGGNCQRIELTCGDVPAIDDGRRLIELNDAIEKLESQDRTKAELVKLKLFAGLTVEESAEVIGISVAKAYRLWEYCRAWLKLELS